MNPRKQLIKRMENFLRCHLAENHPGSGNELAHGRPSITISRQAGTRGLEVGAHLMDYLDQFDESAEHGWALFDQSLLARVIEERNLLPARRPCLAPGFTDNSPHEVVHEMSGLPPQDWSLFQHSADAIRGLCRLGNVIVLGRGANYLTQDHPNTFHVRLVGDAARRARSIAAEHDLDLEKATDYLQALDQARARYVERHLARDINDSAAYHLTINVSRLDPFNSARLIGDAVIEWAVGRSLPMSA